VTAVKPGFDLDEWSPLALEALETIRGGKGVLSLDEFELLLSRAGRIPGPELLAEAWRLERIEVSTLAATISDVWSDCEFPNLALDHDVWREMFRTAGYTRDGQRVERPQQSMELWRGAPPQHSRGWSWTADRAMAERFAYGALRRRLPGRLYRVLAPPPALLCESSGRQESEFVVDTDGLEVEEVMPT